MKHFNLFALLMLLFTGCTVGPNYQPPNVMVPPSFLEKNEELEEQRGSLAHFWKNFDDPVLDLLVQEAINQNLHFQIALEKIAQTRATYHLQAAELFPKIGLDGEARRSRISQTLFESPNLGPTVQNFYRLGFDASWELDLFGKWRRAKEAALYDYESQVEHARDIYLTLLGEVATEYIQIRSFQSQIELQKEKIQLQSRKTSLIAALFESGIKSEIPLSEAREELQMQKQALPPLKEHLQKAIYRLATLLGKSPEKFAPIFEEKTPIPTSHHKVPIGLPSELLRRRPDIREAEKILAASTASVGAAVAELFPSISLFGGYGYGTSKYTKWLSPKSRSWHLAPKVHWPILYFGRLRANIHIHTAQQEEALLSYENTILQALEEVEGNLSAYRQEETRLQEIEKKLEVVHRTYDLEKSLYLSGLSNLISLLQADENLLAAKIEHTLSIQKVSTNLVSLYKSLGGDWPSSSLH